MKVIVLSLVVSLVTESYVMNKDGDDRGGCDCEKLNNRFDLANEYRKLRIVELSYTWSPGWHPLISI